MTRLVRTILPGLPALLFLLMTPGCGNQTPSIPEEKIHLIAENQGGIAIRIVREDPFPWTHVTFTINRLFHYHRDRVEEKELLIPYDQFRRTDGTAYVFNPNNIRLRVTADQGKWSRESERER